MVQTLKSKTRRKGSFDCFAAIFAGKFVESAELQ